jgi:hypothetical protein
LWSIGSSRGVDLDPRFIAAAGPHKATMFVHINDDFVRISSGKRPKYVITHIV